MNSYKVLIVIVLILIFPMQFTAQNKTGTTAAEFLAIPVGARATGMGGAFTGVADDISAIFWNSAGLSRLGSNQVNFTHTEWLVNTSLDWAAVLLKFSDADALSLNFYQLDYGGEEITTPEEPEGTGQNWEAMDMSMGLNYARSLTDRFSFGIGIKYIRQKIWNESASAFAFDAGLLFKTQFSGLSIGMNISNFGTEMQLAGKDLIQPVDIDPSHAGNNSNIIGSLGTDSWPLPLLFQFGLSEQVELNNSMNIILAADAAIPSNQTTYLNLGSEFNWSELLFLRVGYNSIFKEKAEEDFTAGIGLKYNIQSLEFQIDFSYMRYKSFKDIMRYSFTAFF